MPTAASTAAMVPDEPDASRKRRFDDWNDVDLTDSTSEGSPSPKIYINGNIGSGNTVTASGPAANTSSTLLNNGSFNGERLLKKGEILINRET